MIKPRDYQAHALQAAWDFIHTTPGNPLILMPTGTGKSVIPALFLQHYLATYPGRRALLVTHVEKLVQQNFEKLVQVWPTVPAGIHSEGLGRRDYGMPIIYGGIQSMYRNPQLFAGVDLVFVDEAHLVSPSEASMYDTFFAALREANPGLVVIGMTATGWRTNNGPLVGAGVFTHVAVDLTTLDCWNWFVEQGYLARLYSKRTSVHQDAEGVAVTGGDYNLKELSAKVNRPELIEAAVKEMLWWGQQEDRRCWMLFGTSTLHCDAVAECLNDYGVNAVSIHSKQKDAAQRLQAFTNGQYTAAVSMDKLTTGVDIPQVDLLGCLRNTKSSNKWVQMLGRGTRPVYAPGMPVATQQQRLAAMAASVKPNGCRVCDFAHNTDVLGPINDPVVPERPTGRKRGGGGRPSPVKLCGHCLEHNHSSRTHCHACGTAFPITLHHQAASSDAEVMVSRPVEEAAPLVDVVDVQHLSYTCHRKKDRPNSLRVSYYCTGQGGMPAMFTEYVLLEHGEFARRKAAAWWRQRSTMDVPSTVQRALEMTDGLRIPKRLRVWLNPPSKYPEIVEYEYE